MTLLAGATVASRVLSFVLALALARGLGPDDYGVYTLAAAIFTVLRPVTELGLTPYVTREVARDRDRLDAQLGRLVRLRLLAAALGLVVVLTWLVASPGSELARIFAIVYLGLTFESVAYLGYAYLQGLERMGFEAASTLVVALARTGGGVALVVAGASLEVVVGWMALVTLAQLAATGLRLRREGAGRSGRRDPDLGLRAAVVSGGAMMLITLFDAVILRADSLVIGVVEGAREVGIYTAAYTLVTGVQTVPWVLSVALYPVFSRTVGRDPAAFRSALDRSTRAAVLTTLPAALVCAVLAGPIVARVFGSEFEDTAPVLAVLMWWIPLAALSALAGGILRALDREWALAAVLGAGAALNVAGNVVAVPAAGLVGAASVTVGLEAVILAAMWSFARRSGIRPPGFGFLPRAAPAALGMAGVGLALRGVPVEAAVAASVAAYLALLVVFRAVSRDDLAFLRRTLRPSAR